VIVCRYVTARYIAPDGLDVFHDLFCRIQSYFTKKATARGGAVLNRYFDQLYKQFESVDDTFLRKVALDERD
jgi:hypothetical protein